MLEMVEEYDIYIFLLQHVYCQKNKNELFKVAQMS